MRPQQQVLAFFLAALLGSGPLAPPAALAATAPDEEAFFYLMAHSVQVGGETIAYFTYRPQELLADSDGPLLLLASGNEEDVLVWAQNVGLLDMARAQGTPLVLLDMPPLRDQKVMSRVLDAVLDQIW